MSRAHHDAGYYEFLAKRALRCIAPDCLNAREEFHHAMLVPSGCYHGKLPRRHSTYNVIPVCSDCHREIHAGEELWLRRHGLSVVTVYEYAVSSAYTYAVLGPLPHFQFDLDDLGQRTGAERGARALKQLHDALTPLLQ